MRPPSARRLFRLPFRSRRQIAEDLDDELRFHLDQVAAELRDQGWSETDALREAARRFGDLEHTRRYCLDQDRRREQERRRMSYFDELGQDLRQAFRALRAAPGFTAVALITLALGVGANTAIFSVVRAVLLEPLPFEEPDRLVRIWHAHPGNGIAQGRVSEPDFLDWQRENASTASLGAWFFLGGLSGLDLTGDGPPERIEGAAVTGGFFETLGTPPLLGRTLQGEEHVAGRPLAVVLSHGFWTSRFGADPAVLGRTVTLNDESFEIAGVMPRGFTFPASQAIDVWIPLAFYGEDDIGRSRSSPFLDVVGRLKPGVTEGRARAELSALAARLAREHPDNPGWNAVTVTSLRQSMLGEVRRPLLVLMVAVGMLLLIACVNIASLLLARASGRQRELAVRAALGAGPARIARQLLTESLALALAGGVLGALLAHLVVGALAAAGAGELPRAQDIRIDGWVLAFTAGASIFAGLLFGVIPTVQAATAHLERALRADGRGAVGAAGAGLRNALVVAEVALAVVLVVGAALATKSLGRLLAVDPGFDPRGALVVTMSVPERYDTDESRRAHYAAVLDAIRAIPGVRAAGAIRDLPLRGTGERARPEIPGRDTPPGEGPDVQLHHVSADWFRALGVPVHAGREFQSTDHQNAPLVFVANEELARRFWPGEPAVGKRLRFGDEEFPIVGVVGNVRQSGLADPIEPALYVHAQQVMRSRMSIVARTNGDPRRFMDPVRRAIAGLDRNQTITDLTTLESVVGTATARPRLLATLLGAFGLLGLVLGAVGIFGVLAYAVSQRRREIGVRVALGATPRAVLALILGRGMMLAGTGAVLGVAGAVLLTRSMQSVLYEIRPLDAATFAQVVVVVLVVALLASWLPARRALAIDPNAALRYE